MAALGGTVLIGAAASVGVAAPPPNVEPSVPSPPAFRDGVEAYIYGYPLAMLGMTERVATTVSGFTPGASRAPINQFVYGTTLPNGTYKDVVLPSTTTLYEAAFLDVSTEPMVMHIPPIDRFFLMETLDAWTNVSMQSPGTRLDSQPGDYAFVGPSYNKPLPVGVNVIRMPTNTIWIIGRIFTTGTQEDLHHVKHAILKDLTLKPLSAFVNGGHYTPPSNLPVDPSIDTVTTPLRQVKNMDACAFFGTMAALMRTNPPLLPQDERMVRRLKNIGIVPGDPFDCTQLSDARKAVLQGAVAIARHFLANPANSPAQPGDTGWTITLNVGDYGKQYLLRAFVAEKALGANLPQDAVYGYATEDGSKAALRGTGHYQLHFDRPTSTQASGQMPPVSPKAFWSVTIYNNDGTLVDHPGVDYNAIGVGPETLGAIIQGHAACFNPDGSMDIWMQAEKPSDPNHVCNWLPIPPKPADPTVTDEDFIVFLRMYMPEDVVLDSKWIPPGIVQLP
jgi:hypothetical protein